MKRVRRIVRTRCGVGALRAPLHGHSPSDDSLNEASKRVDVPVDQALYPRSGYRINRADNMHGIDLRRSRRALRIVGTVRFSSNTRRWLHPVRLELSLAFRFDEIGALVEPMSLAGTD
jgi:hypothetical protein